MTETAPPMTIEEEIDWALVNDKRGNFEGSLDAAAEYVFYKRVREGRIWSEGRQMDMIKVAGIVDRMRATA